MDVDAPRTTRCVVLPRVPTAGGMDHTGTQPCVARGIEDDKEVWRTGRGGDGRWSGGASGEVGWGREGGRGWRHIWWKLGRRKKERVEREDVLCRGVVGENKTDREEKRENRVL